MEADTELSPLIVDYGYVYRHKPSGYSYRVVKAKGGQQYLSIQTRKDLQHDTLGKLVPIPHEAAYHLRDLHASEYFKTLTADIAPVHAMGPNDRVE